MQSTAIAIILLLAVWCVWLLHDLKIIMLEIHQLSQDILTEQRKSRMSAINTHPATQQADQPGPP